MQQMFFSITTDITTFFSIYAPAGFLLALLVSILYCLAAHRRTKPVVGQLDAGKQTDNILTVVKKGMLFFLLVWYAYIVLGITILSRGESGTRKASFELFRTFQNTFTARKQVYENVIMFVPLAVLLYGWSGRFRRLSVVLVTGMSASLFVEVTQWVTETGYFEVDDILTNTLGMLQGFALCVFAEKVKNGIRKRRSVI